MEPDPVQRVGKGHAHRQAHDASVLVWMLFQGMNPRRIQSIKISHASGASIGITGLTLEEACFL